MHKSKMQNRTLKPLRNIQKIKFYCRSIAADQVQPYKKDFLFISRLSKKKGFRMKLIILSICFVVLVAHVSGESKPVIRNTRADGCVNGRCGPHCSAEGAKVFPGENLDQRGQFRLMQCRSNFDMAITPCSGQYNWVNPDYSKAYPQCCGTKKNWN